MLIRRWNAPSPRIEVGTTRLLRILVAVLACQVWGCAKASVRTTGQTDGGAGDAALQADGKDATGSGVKNDTATPDTFAGVCDPFTNSGCDSDKKCTALQNSDYTLSLGCGDKDNKGEGESCKQIAPSGTQTGDDCADGLACFDINDGRGPTCHRICLMSGTAHACPSSSICSLKIDNLAVLGLAFCQASCKPLEQEGCQSGQTSCYLTDIGAECLSNQPPYGSTKPGATCTHANDCEPGSTCIVSSTTVCASFCSMATNGTPSCSDGKTCNKLPGTPPEPNAGYCK
jgi:hypothetical protein